MSPEPETITHKGMVIPMSMKNKSYIILCLFMLVFPLSAGAAEFTADMVMETPQGNFNGKLFVKGLDIRQDLMISGMETTNLVDLDTATVINLNHQMKMYLVAPANPGALMGESAKVEEKLAGIADVEELGRENLYGYDCRKVKYTFHDSRYGSSTMWFSEKLNYNIRVVNENANGKTSITLENIREEELSPSLFLIPPDYQKMELPNMGD